MPLGSRLYSAYLLMRLIIASTSPCLRSRTLSPPYNQSCQLKSLVSSTSTQVLILFLVSQISQYRLLIAFTRASTLFPLTYINTTSINQSSNYNTIVVRLDNCTSTYSTLMSLQIQSMLQKGHLSQRQAVSTILVQFTCPIRIVITMSLTFRVYSLDITSTINSFSQLSFIKLCYTIYCFRTFS